MKLKHIVFVVTSQSADKIRKAHEMSMAVFGDRVAPVQAKDAHDFYTFVVTHTADSANPGQYIRESMLPYRKLMNDLEKMSEIGFARFTFDSEGASVMDHSNPVWESDPDVWDSDPEEDRELLVVVPEDEARCPHAMFYSGAGACPACGS